MKIALAMAALATLLSAAVMVPRMPAEPRSEPRCPTGCVQTSDLSTPVTATTIAPDMRGPFVVAKPSKSGKAKPSVAVSPSH